MSLAEIPKLDSSHSLVISPQSTLSPPQTTYLEELSNSTVVSLRFPRKPGGKRSGVVDEMNPTDNLLAPMKRSPPAH